MIIDCISDLHGHYPKLEGGDLLIVGGDLTATDSEIDWDEYFNWLGDCSDRYKKIVAIAGNHDNLVEEGRIIPVSAWNPFSTYLCDSGTEFDGLKIWGSPWTKSFEGMNPKCKAFTVDTEEELAKKWALIPDDVDILVTHSPAYGFGDEIDEVTKWGTKQFNVGSPSLSRWGADHAKTLKLHVCGHIHEGYGIWDVRKAKIRCGDKEPSPVLINASHVNERYQPVNKPIRVIL